MVSWSTVVVLLAASAAFGAFCAAVARAFLRLRADRASYRVAAAWGACLVTVLAGSLAVADAVSVDGAAAFAVVAVVASFPLCASFGRWQRTRDMAAAVAYLQLHRAASAAASAPEGRASGWESDLDSTCARLARAYDLTRREEDVLRLLVEGRTFAEAADELVVSLNTVKSHVRRIYAKMGVSGKGDLLAKVSSLA